MHRSRFRAIITMDPAEGSRTAQRQYENHTRALMVDSYWPGPAGSVRYFPAEIWWDDERPLRAGDHMVVTIAMTDDDADTFFASGHQFMLWSGGIVGHGTISRKVFSDYAPS